MAATATTGITAGFGNEAGTGVGEDPGTGSAAEDPEEVDLKGSGDPEVSRSL